MASAYYEKWVKNTLSECSRLARKINSSNIPGSAPETPAIHGNNQLQKQEESDLAKWQCESCSKIQLANEAAFHIDSGQLLCARCFKEIKEYTNASAYQINY